MAEGFAKRFGKGVLAPYSAGSKPSGRIDPDAIKVMAEEGIDISAQRSKGFGELAVKEFDTVVTLGCKDTCPLVAASEHIEWDIDDPKGKDSGSFRRTRDQVKQKVTALVRELYEMENFID